MFTEVLYMKKPLGCNHRKPISFYTGYDIVVVLGLGSINHAT